MEEIFYTAIVLGNLHVWTCILCFMLSLTIVVITTELIVNCYDIEDVCDTIENKKKAFIIISMVWILLFLGSIFIPNKEEYIQLKTGNIELIKNN